MANTTETFDQPPYLLAPCGPIQKVHFIQDDGHDVRQVMACIPIQSTTAKETVKRFWRGQEEICPAADVTMVARSPPRRKGELTKRLP
jgi:hypothetical protein